jgi:hypothetical protein
MSQKYFLCGPRGSKYNKPINDLTRHLSVFCEFIQRFSPKAGQVRRQSLLFLNYKSLYNSVFVNLAAMSMGIISAEGANMGFSQSYLFLSIFCQISVTTAGFSVPD